MGSTPLEGSSRNNRLVPPINEQANESLRLFPPDKLQPENKKKYFLYFNITKDQILIKNIKLFSISFLFLNLLKNSIKVNAL